MYVVCIYNIVFFGFPVSHISLLWRAPTPVAVLFYLCLILKYSAAKTKIIMPADSYGSLTSLDEELKNAPRRP